MAVVYCVPPREVVLELETVIEEEEEDELEECKRAEEIRNQVPDVEYESGSFDSVEIYYVERGTPVGEVQPEEPEAPQNDSQPNKLNIKASSRRLQTSNCSTATTTTSNKEYSWNGIPQICKSISLWIRHSGMLEVCVVLCMVVLLTIGSIIMAFYKKSASSGDSGSLGLE